MWLGGSVWSLDPFDQKHMAVAPLMKAKTEPGLQAVWPPGISVRSTELKVPESKTVARMGNEPMTLVLLAPLSNQLS